MIAGEHEAQFLPQHRCAVGIGSKQTFGTPDAENRRLAALQERAQLRGQAVGIALTGANVDAAAFARVLQNK